MTISKIVKNFKHKKNKFFTLLYQPIFTHIIEFLFGIFLKKINKKNSL